MNRTNPSNLRRGSAMIPVILIVAVSAVVCYAMLGATAVDVRGTAGRVAAARGSADAAAGAKLAIRYLLHPGEAPAGSLHAYTDGRPSYYGGGTFDPAGDGRVVRVGVEDLGDGEYRVTSAALDADGLPERTVRARVRLPLPSGWRPAAAIQAVRLSEMPDVQVAGDVWTGEHLTSGRANVGGKIHDRGDRPEGVEGDPVPSFDELALVEAITCGGSGVHGEHDHPYTFAGVSGNARYVVNGEWPGNAGPNNPAKLYFGHGDLKLKENATINGTIVLRNGDLKSGGGKVKIRPAADGFPAVLVQKNLEAKEGGSFTIDGLTYVGEEVVTDNTHLTLNGALLLWEKREIVVRGPDARVNFDPDLASVKQLTLEGVTAGGVAEAAAGAVQVLEWTETVADDATLP